VRALSESESLRARLALITILKSRTAATLAHIKDNFLTNAHTPGLKRIISAIGELLPDSLDLIKAALAHPSDDVAAEAVGAIAKLPPAECAQELAALLEHPRAVIRLEALRLIGDLKLAQAEDAARDLTSSPSSEVQREACIALGKLGSARSVPDLCRLLRRRGFLGFLGGASPAVRAAAAWALGQIRDQRALPYLRKAASDRNEAVRSSAKLALQSFQT
jgi:HEAT repeat protein